MKIIIVGSGKVGFTIASYLSKEDNDIVIIDKDIETLKKVGESLDVMCIKGNGLSTSVLLEARVNTADIIIAVTSRDEINMLCCLTAKKLGVKHAIARIRDPEYSYELSLLKREMELDLVINPEQEAAWEIGRILRFPSASNIETFVSGKVELVSFTIAESDTALCYKSLYQLTSIHTLMVLFCTIIRGDEVIIPNGNTALQPGDIAYIIGKPSHITEFFKKIGRYADKVKTAMIIGGGRIAFYLGNVTHSFGIKTKVIELNQQRCTELSELLPHCLIINGDGTDEDILKAENIEEMDSVITVTDRDEENLITAMFAKSMGVKKVISKTTRINHSRVIKNLGIESVISPKTLTASQIIRFVRALKSSAGENFEALYKIADGNTEALAFTVTSDVRNLNMPFKTIKFKKGFLVASIVRNNQIIIPAGDDYIAEKDSVIIVTNNENVKDLNDIFA